MNTLFLHTRAGFEGECAAEITERAAACGVYGYCKTRPREGHVLFVAQPEQDVRALFERLAFDQLTFCRQWFAAAPPLYHLEPEDRLTPIMAAVESLPPVSQWWLETLDTNDGKALSGLARKFARPLEKALRRQDRLAADSPWRLHLVFLSGRHAVVGVAPVANSARWAMGIPRLRQPRRSPSRATLKLEEAWHHFIPADQWDQRLAGSQRAVDLGAAPGGWTWLLVQRGLFVEAVDNGPMAPELLETGQVTHQRADGFAFEPKTPVDWLVCDIADKPARVAHLIGRWAANGWCREAIFNLKLPMKQRHAEVEKLRARLLEQLEAQGLAPRLRFKQLYHDREEVTGHLQLR